MIRRVILAAAALAVATPALAQTTFYVVQDTKTKRCTVVETKPTVETMVVLGDGKVYTSRAEAEASVKTYAVCQN